MLKITLIGLSLLFVGTPILLQVNQDIGSAYAAAILIGTGFLLVRKNSEQIPLAGKVTENERNEFDLSQDWEGGKSLSRKAGFNVEEGFHYTSELNASNKFIYGDND